jgi:hypothetical protein
VTSSDLLKDMDTARERLKNALIPGQIDIEGRTMTDDPSAVKRTTKNPSYVVLRLTEERGEAVWEGVGGGVLAASRKQAIEVATTDSEPDLKCGTFAVIPVDQFRIIPRKVRVEEISEFG